MTGALKIVYVTHALTEDNAAGRATGWLGGELSGEGRETAAAMASWPACRGVDAIFTSDLARAVETVDGSTSSSDREQGPPR